MKTPFLALALMIMTAQAAATPVSASKAGSMQTALDDLSLALIDHGYQLVKVQPIDHALVKRGYADPGIRIAFVGKQEQVQQALAAAPALLNLLPLRLTMEKDADGIRISSDDLAQWRERMPSAGPVLQEWEDELVAILNDYRGMH
ncbi:MAG: hypothetical protein GC183_07845 [Thiobacillus sp.]|nr:hypothetical protein [Thiobacillus sp.]